MQRGIGLFGGTFDPVHTGHMALAQAALTSLALESIDFIPAANPWQKNDYTDATHRVAMLEIALKKEPRFQVNLSEMKRSGASYTIDTLRDVRRQYGEGTPLVLLLGGDQWENLQTWRNWQEFTRFSHLAICERDGQPLKAPAEVLAWAQEKVVAKEAITESPCGHIAFFSMKATPASATQIRWLFKQTATAQSLSTLTQWLCPEVLSYIRTHSLYSSNHIHG